MGIEPATAGIRELRNHSVKTQYACVCRDGELSFNAYGPFVGSCDEIAATGNAGDECAGRSPVRRVSEGLRASA